VRTLYKVIENLNINPNDPKVRSLPKTNKSVQQKIMAHPFAVEFLVKVGFDVSNETTISLQLYDEKLI